MRKADWKSIAELIGIAAIVASLLFVGLQMRQSQEIAIAEDCGLLAWSPLATGMISGKYLDGARPTGTRWTISGQSMARDTKQANEAVKAYIAVANKHGLDVCQMALAFINRQPFVTSNIIGATTMEQLKSNIASIKLDLDPEVLQAIDQVYRDYPVPF